MKKVITEVLDVGEPYLLENIDETAVENIINTTKEFDSLATVGECMINCALFRLLQFCRVRRASLGAKIHI
uniref:Uncharacterized protein n=1 Tax=Caenorhabditis japonica TaxID=281687 RepID=A0A8R1E8M1_CAEJA